MVVVVVIVVIVMDNMIIAIAATEADELPFNFSTSRRTCICSVQLTASSSEYPFTLKTLGILSQPVGSGLRSHTTKRSTAFLAQASAPFFRFPEDIEIEKLAIPRRRNGICGQCNPAERETIAGEPRYQILLPEPWAIKCACDDPAQEMGSHYSPM